MKLVLILFVFCTSFIGNTQNIFYYEKEISHKENYNFQDIDFWNIDDKIKLSGTLISPLSNFDKIILIIPGSGKDTRYSHYILTEEFLKNGIAIYRFDERGTGASQGEYSPKATPLINDVTYAISELKKRKPNVKIGALGHSLGGVASIGAFEKKSKIDFLIQMATPIEKNGAFFKYQAKNNTRNYYKVNSKTQEEVVELLDIIFPTIIANNKFSIIKKKTKQIAKEYGLKNELYKFIKPEFRDLVNLSSI